MNNKLLSDKIKAQLNINLTGSFTIEPIEKSLNYWFKKIKILTNLNFVGFNQIFQQLLNPGSNFYSTDNSLNILFVRLEDIINIKSNYDERKVSFKQFLDANIQFIKTNKNNKLLVVFCPPSDTILENSEIMTEFNEYEGEFSSIANNYSNLLHIKSLDFTKKYNLQNYYEPLGEKIGNIPYNDDFFIIASTLISRKIHSSSPSPCKAIIVDCDNTIWKGVVGEEGPEKVTISGVELELQKFLIEQYNSGILICLCSKNIEQDVWRVFELNKNMLLKREHIAFAKINWLPKSQNIIALSKEINIGLDSFVFIDDNPLECNEVNIHIPSVLTIQKRIDTDHIQYIRNSWIFDKEINTQEDAQRTKMYQLEAERKNLRSTIKSYGEYINTLNIKISIKAVSNNEISRVSQLSYRTNQFNTTTIRRNEEEMTQLAKDSSKLVFYTKLDDKFGEYGIVGALIATIKDKSVIVDNFLLSCRALGKGVEHAMISYLGRTCTSLGLDSIKIRFIKSEKNIVVDNFLCDYFNEFLIVKDNESIFDIPVKIANNFTFDPDKTNIQNNTSSDKLNLTTGESDILLRNEFYKDIIENYSCLTNIRNRIESKNIKPVIPDSCTKTEGALLKIWQVELQNPNITVDDNFFEAGGKSIHIPSIIIQYYKQLNIELKIVDIFQYPTIKTLANKVDNLYKNIKKDVVPSNTIDIISKQKEQFKKFKKISF